MNNIFAGGKDWKIEIQDREGYKCINKIWQYGNRNRDIKIAKMIYNVKFLTGMQLNKSNVFNGVHFKTTKDRLNYLSRSGYLLKHLLHIPNTNAIPIYSVGPASFQDLKDERVKSYYRQYNLNEILKFLTINQFFIKLTNIAYVKVNYNVLKPFTAEFEFILKKHGDPISNKDKINKIKLISIRNYENDIFEIERQINRLQERAIMICHDIDTVYKIQGILNTENEKLFKFTTDELLIKNKLSECFTQKVNGENRAVYIPAFE